MGAARWRHNARIVCAHSYEMSPNSRDSESRAVLRSMQRRKRCVSSISSTSSPPAGQRPRRPHSVDHPRLTISGAPISDRASDQVASAGARRPRNANKPRMTSPPTKPTPSLTIAGANKVTPPRAQPFILQFGVSDRIMQAPHGVLHPAIAMFDVAQNLAIARQFVGHSRRLIEGQLASDNKAAAGLDE